MMSSCSLNDAVAIGKQDNELPQKNAMLINKSVVAINLGSNEVKNALKDQIARFAS